MKKGFTLIELLVVVLIIGILAAIALPKYQLAVDKSNFTNALQIIKRVRNLENMYYLSNGKYIYTWEEFISEFPNCRTRTANILKCPYGEIYLNGWGYISLSYKNIVLIQYLKGNDSYKTEQLHCLSDSKRLERLCLSLDGVYKSTNVHGEKFYRIPY